MKLRVARKVVKRGGRLMAPYPSMVCAVAAREILAPAYDLETWLEALRVDERARRRQRVVLTIRRPQPDPGMLLYRTRRDGTTTVSWLRPPATAPGS